MSRAPSLVATSAFVVLGALAACYDEDPSQTIDIANEDLGVYVTVSTDALKNHVRFYVDGPAAGPVFTEGERVYLRVDGREAGLVIDQQGGYVADVDRESKDISVVFERTYDDSAEVAVPTLLDPSLAPVGDLSRARGVTLSWAPSSTPDVATRLVVNAPCLGGEISRNLTGDPGRFTLQPADFLPFEGNCALAITLQRSLQRFGPAEGIGRVQIETARNDGVYTVETTP